VGTKPSCISVVKPHSVVMQNDATGRSLSLSTSFEEGALVVRIGLDTLVISAEQGPLWPRLKVLDGDRFGAALAKEIENDEDESGLTGMMKLIDSAVERLVEDDCDAIRWSDEDIDDLLAEANSVTSAVPPEA